MAKKKGKEIVPVENTDLAEAEFDAFAEEEGAGEDMSREDIAIPRLTLLQSNSPAAQKREPTYIEGADPGMIFDIVNSKLWDGEAGIVVVPLNFRRTFIEWAKRDQGGGFIADHGHIEGEVLMKTTTLDDMGRDTLENGHQLVRTMEYVVYILDESGYQPAIISLVSTQIKYAMRWNTQLSTASIRHPTTNRRSPAPIYYKSWGMTTMPESNDKGSWFSWRISPASPLSELGKEFSWASDWVAFSQECKQFRQLVKDDALRFTPPPSSASPDAVDEEAM